MKIQLGYTPDADDAYMLYGLIRGVIDTGGWQVEAVEASIPALNDYASHGTHHASMISAAAYALVRDRYALADSGATFGLGAGPVIVAREPIPPEKLAGMSVAIPGATTTAYAMLQLFCPALRTRILPLDKLLPAVETGLADCAVVIHEEFVTYKQWGLEVVVDLGRWWHENFDKLPTPVTCCAIRKDLPADQQRQLAGLIRTSVEYSRSHHGEAMDFAMQYSHGAEAATTEKFVRQYVNDLSLEMGDAGHKSLETFFTKTASAKILPDALPLEIV
jgi:1,4-dihydroxy-6-naphthoate synthase